MLQRWMDLAVGWRGEAALGGQLHGALRVDVVEAQPRRVLVRAEARQVRVLQRRAAVGRRVRRRVRRRRGRRLALHELVVAHVAHGVSGHWGRGKGHRNDQEGSQRQSLLGHVAHCCGSLDGVLGGELCVGMIDWWSVGGS